MKDIKLVICDIDNTLVPKHENISERARNAIHHLKEKGILFGLASGRGISQLQVLEKQWNIQCDVLIGLNGSEMYDGISQITEQFYFMEPDWIRQCIEIMAPFECNPHLRRDGINYVRDNDESVSSSNKYIGNTTPPHVVKDDSEFWEKAAPKVGFRVSADIMPQIEEHVSKYKLDGFVGVKTENTMYEFCNSNATKGNLLQVFCNRHNIPLETVCSFGDMTNDISMLEISGVGVCMRNGSEDTKKAANRITDKTVEEDGWADFVEKYIL